MRLVIIGNGIAGITAALTVRRLSTHQVTVISGETEHFYARTALMYLYLGQLKYEHIKGYEDWFWQKNNITLVHDWVNGIDLAQKTVLLQGGKSLPYDKLLLATGSETNFPAFPGNSLSGVHGFYNLQDLAQIEETTANCQEAVILGAGLIGIELAEMLHSRKIKTTILNRHGSYWGANLPEAEAHLVERTLQENGIGYRVKTEAKELRGNAAGQIETVITSSGEKIACGFLGMATGVKPNLKLAETIGLKTGRGILVNEFLKTSIPDIYAAGDCAQLAYVENQVEQLWYTGRMQGETAAFNLCGQKIPYNRGIPFNSAKFFDVEFQSYGLVNPETAEKTNSIYWQHPKKKISLRINYVQQENQSVCGFVAMGMRLRQNVCESWIKAEKSLTYVLNNLEQAFFNEEFTENYLVAIQESFQEQLPQLRIKKPARHFFSWF